MVLSSVLSGRKLDNMGASIAACLMSSAGAAVFLIFPILVGAAMASLQLSTEPSGFLVSE